MSKDQHGLEKEQDSPILPLLPSFSLPVGYEKHLKNEGRRPGSPVVAEQGSTMRSECELEGDWGEVNGNELFAQPRPDTFAVRLGPPILENDDELEESEESFDLGVGRKERLETDEDEVGGSESFAQPRPDTPFVRLVEEDGELEEREESFAPGTLGEAVQQAFDREDQVFLPPTLAWQEGPQDLQVIMGVLPGGAAGVPTVQVAPPAIMCPFHSPH